ncbi:MAG: DUF4340 domain-containing protein [Desulfobacterales bacterium]|jgi:hypothetical protein
MKVKKEYLVLLVIIVALSVYLFMRKEDRTLYELPVLPGISKKDISKIEITKGKTSIVLNKKDDQWYIGDQQYPADKNKVNEMLDTSERLRLTALVSESKNYIRYDLTDDKKVNVKAWQGDTLKRNFDIGKAASSFRHTFVKLADDDRVFHARENFRSKFDQSVDNLREKTVLSVQVSDIDQIHITKDQQSLTLNRTPVGEADKPQETDQAAASPSPTIKAEWQTSDGKIADKPTLNRLLSSLTNLRCDKFIEDRKKEDFTAPLYTVRLKGAKDYNLSIFAKLKDDDSDFPAISSENDYPFLLSKAKAESIMQDPDNFLKRPETDEKKSDPQNPESKQ